MYPDNCMSFRHNTRLSLTPHFTLRDCLKQESSAQQTSWLWRSRQSSSLVQWVTQRWIHLSMTSTLSYQTTLLYSKVNRQETRLVLLFQRNLPKKHWFPSFLPNYPALLKGQFNHPYTRLDPRIPKKSFQKNIPSNAISSFYTALLKRELNHPHTRPEILVF